MKILERYTVEQILEAIGGKDVYDNATKPSVTLARFNKIKSALKQLGMSYKDITKQDVYDVIEGINSISNSDAMDNKRTNEGIGKTENKTSKITVDELYEIVLKQQETIDKLVDKYNSDVKEFQRKSEIEKDILNTIEKIKECQQILDNNPHYPLNVRTKNKEKEYTEILERLKCSLLMQNPEVGEFETINKRRHKAIEDRRKRISDCVNENFMNNAINEAKWAAARAGQTGGQTAFAGSMHDCSYFSSMHN